LKGQFPTNLIVKIRNTGNRKELLNDKRDWKVKYEFVWFCKDIERVYLGREVSDKEKKKESEKFKKNKLINKVNERNLSSEGYKNNSSNILTVLDKYIPPLARKKSVIS